MGPTDLLIDKRLTVRRAGITHQRYEVRWIGPDMKPHYQLAWPHSINRVLNAIAGMIMPSRW